MDFDPQQLAALAAVVDGGTFEAAADALLITPSAVSQRIKALEKSVGQVVVRRVKPCTPTLAGESLLRLERQWRALSAEVDPSAVHTVRIALNSDSLATWFTPVLRDVAARADMALELTLEDQEHSGLLLRSGDVMGAVTSHPVAVQGCVTEKLGAMRYSPVAAPELIERFRGTPLAQWPMVRFNLKDSLQHEVLRGAAKKASVAAEKAGRVHLIPSSQDFMEAVRLGLGWGALPVMQMRAGHQPEQFAHVPGTRSVDVPLFWQRWKVESVALAAVGTSIRKAAEGLV